MSAAQTLCKFGALKTSVLSLSLLALNAQAADEFNTAFLRDVADQVVFDAVAQGYSILPGEYDFTVMINRQRADMHKVRFYQHEQDVVPCINAKFLEDYQIIIPLDQLPELIRENLSPDAACYDLNKLSGASLDADAGMQTLNLSIPQVYLKQHVRGYVSPKLYDQGINALIVNYSASAAVRQLQSGQESSSASMLLNSGFNLGAWRYRNQSAFFKNSGQSASLDSIQNKIERDIIPLKARLELGDTSTRSDVFDSFNFRGVQFSNDQEQLPVSMQNYAPVIRGTARTNAVVEVRQNSYLVYSMNVAPGSFEIKDLYAANDSGDLDIKIIESDGSVQRFIQPYASMPNMARAGQHKYQASVGQYRSGSSSQADLPQFAQLTYSYGLNNALTPYAGIIGADDYAAAAGGLAWSWGSWGAVSADVNYASSTLYNGQKKDGEAVRLLYAKTFNRSGTDVRFSGSHYGDSYFSFSDAAQEKAQWKDGAYEYQYRDTQLQNDTALSDQDLTRSYYSSVFFNKKNQIQLSLNQNLGKWGQIYANISNTQFWQKEYDQRNWQLGYSGVFRRMSYSLFYQNSRSLFNGSDYSFGLNLSLPLDDVKALKKHDALLNSSYHYSPVSGASMQSALSGNFLQDKNLQIQLQAGHAEKSGESFNTSAYYRGSKLNANAGYSHAQQYQQLNAGISGGILVHSNGLLFGQQMDNSPILIEAKGAQNIRVENQNGLKVDKHGYAVISSSSPYAKNRVALRAEDIGQNVFIDEIVKNDIVPTKMAVVKVKFEVKNGQSVLVNLMMNGKDLAAGTEIVSRDYAVRYGLVGLNSQAFLTNVESGQKLAAKWGSADYQQCTFTLPVLEPREIGYDEINLSCEAGALQ